MIERAAWVGVWPPPWLCEWLAAALLGAAVVMAGWGLLSWLGGD